jgi:hypothetical protein
MSKQKLSKYEKKERELGQQFLYSFPDKIRQAAFTPPNSYSIYDGWYTTITEPDVSTCFEIKVRDFEYTKYPDYIIEEGKLRNLAKLYKEGKHIKYINFFKKEDGFYDCIVFDLDKRLVKWKEEGHIPTQVRKMNAATFKSKYDKVEKTVIMLAYDPSIDSLITDTQWQ